MVTYYTSPHFSHIALIDVHDVWEHNKLSLQLPYIDQFDIVKTKYIGNEKDIKKFNSIINTSCVIKKTQAQWNIWDNNYNHKGNIYIIDTPLVRLLP